MSKVIPVSYTHLYAKFNDTPTGQTAKKCVENGDLNAFSIWANGLQKSGQVVNCLLYTSHRVLHGRKGKARVRPAAELDSYGGAEKYRCRNGVPAEHRV